MIFRKAMTCGFTFSVILAASESPMDVLQEKINHNSI
jgi:hypothetical protein